MYIYMYIYIGLNTKTEFNHQTPMGGFYREGKEDPMLILERNIGEKVGIPELRFLRRHDRYIQGHLLVRDMLELTHENYRRMTLLETNMVSDNQHFVFFIGDHQFIILKSNKIPLMIMFFFFQVMIYDKIWAMNPTSIHVRLPETPLTMDACTF